MLKNWKRMLGCPCTGQWTCDNGELPLANAQPGKRVKVKRIEGGRSLCARMAALGIYPGAEIDLLCAGCGSPCLVRLHGGTLSLGVGVSEKILVSPAV